MCRSARDNGLGLRPSSWHDRAEPLPNSRPNSAIVPFVRVGGRNVKAPQGGRAASADRARRLRRRRDGGSAEGCDRRIYSARLILLLCRIQLCTPTIRKVKYRPSTLGSAPLCTVNKYDKLIIGLRVSSFVYKHVRSAGSRTFDVRD